MSNENVEKVWNEFWKPLVTQKNGFLDIERLKQELYDAYVAMEEVGIAYDYVTGGIYSKPNTSSVYIIAAFDDYVEGLIDEAVTEAIEEYSDPYSASIDSF